VNLVARLAERAGVPRSARVLDVACGLGGSALWLARHLDYSVTGITRSPAQAQMASKGARAGKLTERLRFLVLDANHLDLAPESFEVVWVIECSEHLADKARFLASCARLLGSGGRLALCAWVVTERGIAEHRQLIAEACRGMLSIPSRPVPAPTSGPLGLATPRAGRKPYALTARHGPPLQPRNP
jgi:tocopherol O-methyltransferase